MAATPPRLAAPPPPNGGNCIIRAATRRRYPASQLLMLQIPHHSQPEMRRAASKTWAQHRLARKNSPSTALPPAFPRKTSPSTLQTTDFRPFFVRWANYFALTHTIRSSRANFFAHGTPPMGTLKPTTPLHAPEQQPLKPPSPIHPKNAPNTPISHPQRRCRFQSRPDLHPQRRWQFQTTGPPVQQGLTAAPVGNIRYKRRQTGAI